MNKINLCPRRPDKFGRTLGMLRADRSQHCLVPTIEIKLRFPEDVQDQIIVQSSTGSANK